MIGLTGRRSRGRIPGTCLPGEGVGSYPHTPSDWELRLGAADEDNADGIH